MRHRAAVGLSERSDSFIAVVSEERGMISLAYHGDLKVLSGADELKTELDKFLKEGITAEKKPVYAWLTTNIKEKIIAAVLAVFLWFLFVFQSGVISQEFKIPVEIKYPPQNLTVEPNPKEITITLNGRSQDFQLLNPEDLKVSIDSSGFKEGTQKIKIEEKLINHPDALSVTNFTPKIIQVHIIKIINKIIKF